MGMSPSSSKPLTRSPNLSFWHKAARIYGDPAGRSRLHREGLGFISLARTYEAARQLGRRGIVPAEGIPALAGFLNAQRISFKAWGPHSIDAPQAFVTAIGMDASVAASFKPHPLHLQSADSPSMNTLFLMLHPRTALGGIHLWHDVMTSSPTTMPGSVTPRQGLMRQVQKTITQGMEQNTPFPAVLKNILEVFFSIPAYSLDRWAMFEVVEGESVRLIPGMVFGRGEDIQIRTQIAGPVYELPLDNRRVPEFQARVRGMMAKNLGLQIVSHIGQTPAVARVALETVLNLGKIKSQWMAAPVEFFRHTEYTISPFESDHRDRMMRVLSRLPLAGPALFTCVEHGWDVAFQTDAQNSRSFLLWRDIHESGRLSEPLPIARVPWDDIVTHARSAGIPADILTAMAEDKAPNGLKFVALSALYERLIGACGNDLANPPSLNLVDPSAEPPTADEWAQIMLPGRGLLADTAITGEPHNLPLAAIPLQSGADGQPFTIWSASRHSLAFIASPAFWTIVVKDPSTGKARYILTLDNRYEKDPHIMQELAQEITAAIEWAQVILLNDTLNLLVDILHTQAQLAVVKAHDAKGPFAVIKPSNYLAIDALNGITQTLAQLGDTETVRNLFDTIAMVFTRPDAVTDPAVRAQSIEGLAKMKKSLLKIMKDQTMLAEVSDILKDLNQLCDTIVATINQWQNMSKGLDPKKFSTTTAVTVTGELLEELMAARPSQFSDDLECRSTIKLPDEAPVILTNKELVFSSIIPNLIDNSEKAIADHMSFEGDHVIDITVVPDGDFVEIRIRDTGVGMSPEVLAQINSEHGVNRSGRSDKASTGQAVKAFRSLLSMMGASLHFDSDGPGQGATAILRFPAARTS